MDDSQRSAIRTGYAKGHAVAVLAIISHATVQDVNIYLASWCDLGCPDVKTES